jgi:hypothetical protein
MRKTKTIAAQKNIGKRGAMFPAGYVIAAIAVMLTLEPPAIKKGAGPVMLTLLSL